MNELKRQNNQIKTLISVWRYQKLFASEMEKSTSQCDAPVLAKVVKDTPIEALQVRFDSTKEEVKPSLFILAGEVVAGNI